MVVGCRNVNAVTKIHTHSHKLKIFQLLALVCGALSGFLNVPMLCCSRIIFAAIFCYDNLPFSQQAVGSMYGFIGLGNMGSRMAGVMVRKGFNLTVYDAHQPSVQGLVGLGAGAASSPREVAQASNVIITMLPNADIVKEVYRNAETGIFASAQPGSLLIDCSTIDAETPKQLHAVTQVCTALQGLNGQGRSELLDSQRVAWSFVMRLSFSSASSFTCHGTLCVVCVCGASCVVRGFS